MSSSHLRLLCLAEEIQEQIYEYVALAECTAINLLPRSKQQPRTPPFDLRLRSLNHCHQHLVPPPPGILLVCHTTHRIALPIYQDRTRAAKTAKRFYIDVAEGLVTRDHGLCTAHRRIRDTRASALTFRILGVPGAKLSSPPEIHLRVCGAGCLHTELRNLELVPTSTVEHLQALRDCVAGLDEEVDLVVASASASAFGAEGGAKIGVREALCALMFAFQTVGPKARWGIWHERPRRRLGVRVLLWVWRKLRDVGWKWWVSWMGTGAAGAK